jgi:hypothetical protein
VKTAFLICALALPPQDKVQRAKWIEPYLGLMIQPESYMARPALKDFVKFMLGRRSA